MKSLLFFLIFLITGIHVLANDTIVVPANQFGLDFEKSLIVSNFDPEYINATWTSPKTAIVLDDTYTFMSPIAIIEMGEAYTIQNQESQALFTLYFTPFPIIKIDSDNEIVDEPRVLANFCIVEPNQNEISTIIGVEYRGGWTQTLPKKSLRLEFWATEDGAYTINVGLLGMRSDDDWNLQAMYNEPLRLRTKTVNELWKLIYSPYYLDEEPHARTGVKVEYTEVFLNAKYMGIYGLSERTDRKQLRLKTYDNEVHGQLFKGISWGASTFSALPSYNNSSTLWSGFEYRYPDEEIDWSDLYEFISFAMNSENETFYQNYQNYFHLDNAIDYFLFLNLMRATDNAGKNIFIARYDTAHPYFYDPYDFDGTFGNLYDGTQDNITDDLLTNGFYQRLWHDCQENGFREKLSMRWGELRNGIITEEFIMNLFQSNYAQLLESGAYERESIAWTDYTMNSDDLNYMSEWLSVRLSYLDTKFEETCQLVSTTSIKEFSELHVYPNPTSHHINVICENPGGANLHFYNAMGQLVRSTAIDEGRNIIQIKNLNAGLYMLHITGTEYKKRVKLVVN